MCKKLRDAAQELIRVWDDEETATKVFDAIDALRAALAEDRLAEYMPPKRDEQPEYALWGVVVGNPGGRWPIQQINPNEVWPVGTALYVRRVKE